MSRLRRITAGLVLAMANFMVILDMTIANVSIPHIAGSLGITLEQGAWIITSYAVAEAICVPLTGWVAQRFGSVRTFLFSMAGFGVFSMLCGLSVTLGMLVACRIGQGIFGAFLMPMSQTLLLRVFPPEQQNIATAMWAMTLLMGPAVGPLIGGHLTENLGWHWIFLINIPVAVLCVGVGFVLLRPIETDRRFSPIDFVGLVLLVLWVGCLQIVLDLGRNRDWFGDPVILAVAITSLVGFLVFVIWELGEDHPVVDLRVLRHRGYTISVTVLALAFGGYFVGLIIVPQWQQAWLGFPATAAGVSSSFAAIGGVFTAPVAAMLMARVDARWVISGGILWVAAIAVVRTTWITDAGYWSLTIPQLIQGLGVPFMILPLLMLTLNTVEEGEVASAAGIQSFMRTLAAAVATSVSLSFWADSQRAARNEVAGAIHPEVVQERLAGFGFAPDQVRQVLSDMVDRETTTLALIHVFWLSTAVLVFSALLIWLSPRPKVSGGMQMGH